MADITVTAAKVAVLFPDKAEIFDGIAAEAITRGQAVYVNSNGKLALADANASGKEGARGIALNPAGAGGGVSVLKKGHVGGFTLGGAYDSLAYLSDTAGALADAPSTSAPVPVGRVVPISDNDLTKVLFVDAAWGKANLFGSVFVSTEQTGNGSAQNVAHGLGVVPKWVLIVPTDTAPATTGAYTATEGTHTSTNVVVTVTSGKKYKVLAIG